MSDQLPQTRATHRRFDPAFHFFLAPVLAINAICALVAVFRHFGLASVWGFLVAAAIAVAGVKIRLYALRVQDRLIRLEERLRLQSVLGEPLRARIPELREGQLVGLRFAADEDLPALVQLALDEKLSGESIKKRIQHWRPDTFRV